MNKVLLSVLAFLIIAVGVIMSRSTQNNSGLTDKTLGQSTETSSTDENSIRQNNDEITEDGGEPTMDQNNSKVSNELKIEDTTVGTGKEAKSGSNITVHYRGKLTDGTVFDESYKRNQPFKFVLGAGMVIQGWEQGFEGMKEGGKRTLTIPASLGYGSTGAGGVIPPNATLIFDVELLKVE